MRFGWIDFVDDIEVSTALLKAVEDYGKQKGMKEIVGPLGFTDMDPEGMLLEGYDQLGTQATAYNYPYYPEHMDRMGGWEKDNDYVEYKLYVPEEMPEKYATIAKMIQKRYNLQVKKLKRNEIYGENGYGKKIFNVVNETFKDLYGYSKLTASSPPTERADDLLLSELQPTTTAFTHFLPAVGKLFVVVSPFPKECLFHKNAHSPVEIPAPP